MLSNAILQTGALLATCRDDAAKDRLGMLKDTLTKGMDSVRASVHGLYEESVDLYAEVKRLVDGFDFCPILMDFDMDSNPDKKVKYTMLIRHPGGAVQHHPPFGRHRGPRDAPGAPGLIPAHRQGQRHAEGAGRRRHRAEEHYPARRVSPAAASDIGC